MAWLYGEDYRMRRRVKALLEFPYTFVKMNSAAVVGLYVFLRGREDIWVRPADIEVWEASSASLGAEKESQKAA